MRARGLRPRALAIDSGLAEAWTGGSYELRDEELSDFPFDGTALRPHYATVADRIGITALEDDLRHFSPLTASYLTPLPMDAHSAWLHERYDRRRLQLNTSGFFLGRSRVAVLSSDRAERRSCGELGRCLWGCPRGSLYAPNYQATVPDLAGIENLPGAIALNSARSTALVSLVPSCLESFIDFSTSTQPAHFS